MLIPIWIVIYNELTWLVKVETIMVTMYGTFILNDIQIKKLQRFLQHYCNNSQYSLVISSKNVVV